jgi:hypothetical protein
LTQAGQAAADYCATLISDQEVLSAQNTSPKPYVVPKAAENGADMAVSILFDITACPSNKANSTVDFVKLGQTQCEEDLYGALSEVCAEDKTWSNFNPDFTMEGGVYANDCALWAINGQGSS